MPQLYTARRWGIDLGTMPRITAIEAALALLPDVDAAHPDRCTPES
jgi:maleylacetoacetate isomerase